ncbi:NAD(P)-dependent oxidoreductase [Parvibaculum sp.]|uniref:NAD(P)-dependent oxidoreductase n=2 Tax=Parvibaculum sp. TaxID=2024848 RepID=UPI001B18CBBF|nr:NAD(P)-dependent oxidoreductase [Parvibaculum sp.]MBO6679183.1 hydroxyacid dehydrogenase [Parvibaculum sp.]MBO6685694.1 hydroxyacid dehydrogenase [Parvibaculum sp.]
MEKKKIVVTNRVFPETRALLEAHAHVVVNEADEPWPAEILLEHCRDAFGLMAFMTDSIGADFIAACPALRIVGAALKGYDNIDVDACTRAGVTVTIVPDLLTVPTAELAIGLMLSLGRNILSGDAAIRKNGFAGWRPSLYGAGLDRATVGILGFGLVGQAIAERLQPFRCRLLASDAARRPETAFPHVTFMDMEDVIAEADWLVLALPLTTETQHLIGRAAIARMKPGARIVNPARGSLVDEVAIADALATGHIAGYAADVFECEDWARDGRPGDIDARLLADGARTVLTPHIGSAVIHVRRDIELSAARCIVDAIAGRSPAHAVNAPAGALLEVVDDVEPAPHKNVSGGR